MDHRRRAHQRCDALQVARARDVEPVDVAAAARQVVRPGIEEVVSAADQLNSPPRRFRADETLEQGT